MNSTPVPEPVAAYTFAGQSLGSQTNGSTSTAGNISGGITGNVVFSTVSDGPLLDLPANFVGSSQADALANDKYVGFTITPTIQQLEYFSLGYRIYLTNFGGTNANGTVEARWSLDSFAAPLTTSNLTALPVQTFTTTANTGLPGTSGSPVEFRFYFFADTSASNVLLGIDNVLVFATPVP